MKHLRELRGWTLRELERRSGVSRASINQFELGDDPNPTLDILLRLQLAFGLDSLEALLGLPPSAVMARVTPGARRD